MGGEYPNDTVALHPCPFCYGDARRFDDDGRWRVECKHCGARSATVSDTDTRPEWEIAYYGKTPEDHVTRLWNDRVPFDPFKPRVRGGSATYSALQKQIQDIAAAKKCGSG